MTFSRYLNKLLDDYDGDIDSIFTALNIPEDSTDELDCDEDECDDYFEETVGFPEAPAGTDVHDWLTENDVAHFMSEEVRTYIDLDQLSTSEVSDQSSTSRVLRILVPTASHKIVNQFLKENMGDQKLLIKRLMTFQVLVTKRGRLEM